MSSAGRSHAGLLAGSECTCTLIGINSMSLVIMIPIVTVLIELPLGMEARLVGSQRSNALVQPEPV